MKLGRNWIACFCAFAFALTTFAQEQEAVRPSGVPEPLSKESPPKATRARSPHRHAKTKVASTEEGDQVSPPPVSGGVPATLLESENVFVKRDRLLQIGHAITSV